MLVQDFLRISAGDEQLSAMAELALIEGLERED
jgi:hypothetical protein